MKYTDFYVLFILSASSAMAAMELTTPTKGNKAFIQQYNTILTSKAKSTKPQQGYTFITDEPQPQHITIPLTLAMQCNTIKTMLEDCESDEMPAITINDVDTENALLFISYLKKISYPNTLLKNLSKKQTHNAIQNNEFLLKKYIRSLDTTELINLTHIVDSFDVTDKNNNNHLITELTERICATPVEKIKDFESLNNRAIFRSIMQKISKSEKLDIKFIQPYSDTLTEQYSLPRTEWRLMSLCTKIYNGFSWDIITRYKPYYMNTQTGTIIKSEEIVNELCNTTKTNNLCIFKKNSSPITINLKDIDKITHIRANNDESLFIGKFAMRRHAFYPGANNDIYIKSNKCFLINLNNTDNQPQPYNACAFTQNNKEVYVGYDDNKFGILNTATNVIAPINLNNNNKIFDISTNDNNTIVAVSTGHDVFIGKKTETNSILFKDKVIYFTDETFITNICLHPTENQLYIQTAQSFCIIDLTSLETIISSPLPHYQIPDLIGFPSKDILLLCCEKGDDCFFNIKTGNYWTKKKQYNSIGRLALTADLMNSIEEIKSDFGDKHNRRITVKSAPIITQEIIKTVECTNEGYLPLSLLTIANTKSDLLTLSDNDVALLNNQNEHFKAVITNTKTITDTSPQSVFINSFTHLYQKMRRIYPTALYYSKTAIIYTLYVTATIALILLNTENNTKTDKIPELLQEIHSLIDQMFWLVE